MSSIRRLHGNGRLSKAVVHNGIVYLTGQVAEDHPGGDVTEQTREVLQRIDALLEEAGSDKAHILNAYLYVADMARFAEVNAAWDAWVSKGNEPARTTIEARLTAPDFAIEIGVIAAAG
jgi:enamine deaminase RidA (YjgF/YER057c/UK114 family)